MYLLKGTSNKSLNSNLLSNTIQTSLVQLKICVNKYHYCKSKQSQYSDSYFKNAPKNLSKTNNCSTIFKSNSIPKESCFKINIQKPWICITVCRSITNSNEIKLNIIFTNSHNSIMGKKRSIKNRLEIIFRYSE